MHGDWLLYISYIMILMLIRSCLFFRFNFFSIHLFLFVLKTPRIVSVIHYIYTYFVMSICAVSFSANRLGRMCALHAVRPFIGHGHWCACVVCHDDNVAIVQCRAGAGCRLGAHESQLEPRPMYNSTLSYNNSTNIQLYIL